MLVPRDMAFLKTLDIYRDLILPRLEDGPKPQVELDVPRYALEALQREGLVRMRTRVVGVLALQYWCLPDYAEEKLRDCALMSFDELPDGLE